jgi:BlaI family transcriptional regulator, penicillinase repressor
MMKCRCDLNECLEKRFFRFLTSQPDSFPMLMRIEKLLVAVTPQPFSKGSATPIKSHRSPIIRPLLEVLPGALGQYRAIPTKIFVDKLRSLSYNVSDMMTKPTRPVLRPTEAELELLEIVWERQPATVREIYNALNQERASGYTTVLKLLQIMTAKGLVVRDEANRAHVYRGAMKQDDMQSRLLKDLSVRLFSGSAAQLAMHALEMEPASSAELDEIRALIERNRNPCGSTILSSR